MTKLELAQRTKAKYPQYKDIDDNELAERILAKYPVYKSQITEQEKPSAIQNIKESLVSRGQDIKEAGQKAIEKGTVGAGAKLALRTAGAVAGGLNDVVFEGLKAVVPDKIEQLAKSGIGKAMSTEPAQYVAEKISAWAKRNPESARDLQDVLEISSAIPTIKGAQVAGRNAIKASKTVLKTGKKALGKTLATTGAVVEKGGKAVVSATYPPTPSQAKSIIAYKAKTPLLQRVSETATGVSKAPTTPADVAVKYGLVGLRRSDIGAKAQKTATELFQNQVKPVVEGITKKVKTANIFDDVATKINQTADVSKKKALLNALDSLKNDYKGTKALSYSQLDKIKSEMAKGLPAKVWKGQDIAGDINNVRKIFSDKARAIIRKELPNEVKTIYDEYGSLLNIVEKGEKSLQRGLDTGVLGLTSEAIRTAGTPITTIGGKAISDIGTATKKLGQKLLKTKPLPKGKGEILKSKPLKTTNPIIQEAKKYKTVDKFVKAQEKNTQLDTIKKNNPMTDDYHTGIRFVDDIKTLKETLNDPESFVYPDFSKKMADKAIKDGKITIYSSKPLDKNAGQFISPSKMNASDYAGGGKIYSKTVNIDEVAWINGDEGQLVGNTKSQLTDIWNKANKAEPLVEEARKYKSADEFIKAQTPDKDYVTVYHRTNTPIEDFGKSKTFSKENAGEFFVSNRPNEQITGYGDNVLELRVKKNKLEINDEFPSGEEHYTIPVVEVDNIIKTKSQLTDIWNKANKKLKK